ncbi:calcium-binding protein [Paracoccus alkanivorans]|uniref:Calcium-binding protein n=1 Tax=Paracoccus alkanivorans TaxID=2116655 RepID=A0A3M0MMM2_9RHOB|nr:calcium-binding protein [Paracoccus alkanivorans]RMC37574.1 calcium-binding protein [Paracoccus alkanivorans]
MGLWQKDGVYFATDTNGNTAPSEAYAFGDLRYHNYYLSSRYSLEMASGFAYDPVSETTFSWLVGEGEYGRQEIVYYDYFSGDGVPLNVIDLRSLRNSFGGEMHIDYESISGSLTIYGTENDDVISVRGTGYVEVNGGDGDDRIEFFSNLESSSKLLRGGAGNDVVLAGDGTDTIGGGSGNDRLHGGRGENLIYGDEGDDRITSGGGDDTISAGSGDDWIDGDTEDIVSKGYDNDAIYGGEGNDTIYGRGGDDTIYGSPGNDNIAAGTENDYVQGGAENDRIYGGAGSDTLFGNDGDDTIYGGKDTDVILGGAGIDFFVFEKPADSTPGISRDVIRDFEVGQDKIVLSALDADTTKDGNQSFSWSLNDAPNSVWVGYWNGRALIRADADGDAVYDFEIQLNQVSSLSSTDFIF